MLSSRTYQRIKADHTNEFEPKAIFFCDSSSVGNETDWGSCFQLKAAVVYSAITGRSVNKQTASQASHLLLHIAKNCLSGDEKKNAEEAIKEKASDPSELAVKVPHLMEMADGIFLVVGFLPELKKDIGEWNRETSNETIITDIIKIENQLPLQRLIEIVEQAENAIKESRDSLEQKFKEKDSRLGSLIDKYKPSVTKDTFHEIIHLFCRYYSPITQRSKYIKPPEEFKKEVLEKKNLLECLHFSLIKNNQINDEVGGHALRTPAARPLKRSGVKLEGHAKGVIDVSFSDSTLRIPEIIYDFKLGTVVKNLMAWECLHDKHQKPVARYFQTINELVNEVGDVRVLKKSGILKGSWKNDHEILDLVKKFDGFASYPSAYSAVDKEIKKVKDFYDARMKSFLVRNKPAVVWVSSVAAVSVLITAVYASRKRG